MSCCDYKRNETLQGVLLLLCVKICRNSNPNSINYYFSITAHPQVFHIIVLIRSAGVPWSVWETPPPGASLDQKAVRSGSEALTGTLQQSLCPSGSAGFLPRRTDPRLTAGEKKKGKEV